MFPSVSCLCFQTKNLRAFFGRRRLLGNTPGGATLLGGVVCAGDAAGDGLLLQRFRVDGSAARSPMRGVLVSVRSAASVPGRSSGRRRLRTPYRQAAARSPSPPPPARGTNREDLPTSSRGEGPPRMPSGRARTPRSKRGRREDRRARADVDDRARRPSSRNRTKSVPTADGDRSRVAETRAVS